MATTASAAVPPSARIPAPTSAVAGCPAATPGPHAAHPAVEANRLLQGSLARLLAFRRPRSRLRRVTSFTRGGERGIVYERSSMSLTKEVKLEVIEKHGSGPGRHGIAAGPDRDADAADQRPDRAPPSAPEGSLLPSGPPEARRPPPPLPRLLAAQGHRGLPSPHQGARPEKVGLPSREGGSLSESAVSGGADSNLHLPETKE